MIRRIARPMLGSIFIYSGIQALRNPEPLAEAAKPMVDTAADVALPSSSSPATDARRIVRLFGGAQLGAGTLLALGRAPRISSLVLAGTLVPATATHQFWNESDPAARQQQTLHFLKNLSIGGGLLIAGFDTEGKPGLQWRARRAAERAVDRTEDLVDRVTPDRMPFASHDDSASKFAEAAKQKAEQLAATSSDRLSDAVDRAKPALAHAAATTADNMSTAKSVLSKRAAELDAQVRPAVENAVAEKVPEAKRKAKKLRKKARGQLQELADQVR